MYFSCLYLILISSTGSGSDSSEVSTPSNWGIGVGGVSGVSLVGAAATGGGVGGGSSSG